jgi:hypothetical protein
LRPSLRIRSADERREDRLQELSNAMQSFHTAYDELLTVLAVVVSDVEVDGEYQFERVRYSSSHRASAIPYGVANHAAG